ATFLWPHRERWLGPRQRLETALNLAGVEQEPLSPDPSSSLLKAGPSMALPRVHKWEREMQGVASTRPSPQPSPRSSKPRPSMAAPRVPRRGEGESARQPSLAVISDIDQLPVMLAKL